MTDDDLRIVVDIESLTGSRSPGAGARYVTGVISVILDGAPYPGLSWNDQIDALLSHRSEKCRHLQSGGRTADFVIFDEPEGFLVTSDDGVCAIEFYRRTVSHRQIVMTASCRLEVLVSEIARCSKQVWSACVRNGWPSDHARALENAWRGLQR